MGDVKCAVYVIVDGLLNVQCLSYSQMINMHIINRNIYDITYTRLSYVGPKSLI